MLISQFVHVRVLRVL